MGHMSYPARELLVKSVLSTMSTYFLTVFKLHRWMIKGIDRFRRGFLWKGHNHEHTKGGHYLVNWQPVLGQEYVVVLTSKILKNSVELLDYVGFDIIGIQMTDNGTTS
jgi:hypothetical protein